MLISRAGVSNVNYTKGETYKSLLWLLQLLRIQFDDIFIPCASEVNDYLV